MKANMPIRRRLDHGPMFVCVTIGLFFGAIYILSHWFEPTPLFSWLSLATENTMGVVQLLGCLGVFFGMLSGTRYFRSGADLRGCYDVVKWSCLPIGVAFGTFLIGAIFTGWVQPWYSETMLLFYGVEVGLFFVATELNFESRRLTRELHRRVEASLV